MGPSITIGAASPLPQACGSSLSVVRAAARQRSPRGALRQRRAILVVVPVGIEIELAVNQAVRATFTSLRCCSAADPGAHTALLQLRPPLIGRGRG
jgi:hypothetical protein